MRIAYHAETLIEAHLVKDALEQAEIPAFIAGEFFTGIVGQATAGDFLTVMVPEAALAKAEDVVRIVGLRPAEARAAAVDDDDSPDSVSVPA